jgi:hypothetical protein
MTNEWDEADEAEDDELGPGSADYDLSEEHGYTWEPEREDEGPIPRWALTWVSVAVIAALVLPALILIWRYG